MPSSLLPPQKVPINEGLRSLAYQLVGKPGEPGLLDRFENHAAFESEGVAQETIAAQAIAADLKCMPSLAELNAIYADLLAELDALAEEE